MFFQTLEPQQQDTEVVSLNKSVQLMNLLLGGASPLPDFYPDGSVPARSDTYATLLMKMAGASYTLIDTF